MAYIMFILVDYYHILVDAILVVYYTACYSCKVILHNLQLID